MYNLMNNNKINTIWLRKRTLLALQKALYVFSDLIFPSPPMDNHNPDFCGDSSVVIYLFFLVVLPLMCKYDCLFL